MKKTALLIILAAFSFAANAQLWLSGSGPYNQSFDSIGSGLPTGWSVYSGAAHNFLGTTVSFNSSTSFFPSYAIPDTPSTCISGVLTGGFKNYPSADVLPGPSVDFCAATPPTFTNRALGVRQVSPTNSSHPNLDSGAAFVLKLANTNGMTGVAVSFKLQSLDTASSRTTTWIVDYGVGSSPTTFTPAASTTGTFTTGGHAFSNNACTASFGSALDNQSQNVYIRITTLVFSTGSGNRASTGIDDFSLTWTGTAKTGITNIAANPEVSLIVLGAATSDQINFRYNAAADADYNFVIYDMAGRVLHSQQVIAKTNDQQINVDGLHLAPGMYFARMSNSNSSSVTKVMVQ